MVKYDELSRTNKRQAEHFALAYDFYCDDPYDYFDKAVAVNNFFIVDEDGEVVGHSDHKLDENETTITIAWFAASGHGKEFARMLGSYLWAEYPKAERILIGVDIGPYPNDDCVAKLNLCYRLGFKAVEVSWEESYEIAKLIMELRRPEGDGTREFSKSDTL